MGVFGDIRGYFGGSGSVFMIIALAGADYLWGEHVFNCPCGDYRILYTCAFLIVPPVAIILIDVSWKALVSTCKQNCCPCGELCQEESCTCGQCGSGARSTCCDYSTCETVVRLTARPVTIAVVWVIFSFIEPRFGKCLFREVSCNCTEAELQDDCISGSKEEAAKIRVFTAAVMLGLTALVAIILLLFLICGRCCARILRFCGRICSCCDCCRRRCDRINTCYQTWIETDDLKSQRALTRTLYILGLKPQTVITLQEQNLMDEMLLVNLSDDAVRGIDNSISVGQLEILRKHRRNIRLVKLLLQRNYSEADIRKILKKDGLIGQTWDNVRDPLNSTGTVPNDAVTNLRGELRRLYKIVPANAAPEGDGMGQADNVRVSLNSTDTVPKDAATNLPEELSQKFPVKAKPEGDGQADEPARDAQTAI